MKTIIHDELRTALEEFADSLGLTMLVWFNRDVPGQYAARFDNGFFDEGPSITKLYGLGPSVRAAILDYANKISHQIMHIDMRRGDETTRIRIRVPELIADTLPGAWSPETAEVPDAS